jgi:hypothetical protein
MFLLSCGRNSIRRGSGKAARNLHATDDNALPPMNTGFILKRRYGGNDVISPERWAHG